MPAAMASASTPNETSPPTKPPILIPHAQHTRRVHVGRRCYKIVCQHNQLHGGGRRKAERELGSANRCHPLVTYFSDRKGIRVGGIREPHHTRRHLHAAILPCLLSLRAGKVHVPQVGIPVKLYLPGHVCRFCGGACAVRIVPKYQDMVTYQVANSGKLQRLRTGQRTRCLLGPKLHGASGGRGNAVLIAKQVLCWRDTPRTQFKGQTEGWIGRRRHGIHWPGRTRRRRCHLYLQVVSGAGVIVGQAAESVTSVLDVNGQTETKVTGIAGEKQGIVTKRYSTGSCCHDHRTVLLYTGKRAIKREESIPAKLRRQEAGVTREWSPQVGAVHIQERD